MSNETIIDISGSRPDWSDLEDWVRIKAQGFIQDILEEEVTEFLGRGKSERRDPVDARPGYRNGYGRERKLTLSCGTIGLRRPRVRDSDDHFESRVLPLFARRSTKIRELIPELYLHGLSEGDFDLALRGLLGDDAPLSASTVARLKEKWQDEFVEWGNRSLGHLEVVYVWVDGVYVKAGFEKEKSAVLVVLGALSDGSKVVLGISSGYRESTESWSAVLRGLKRRGMNCPKLVVGDGNLGIWGALANVYPEAAEQRCWNHKMMNVLDRLPKREQPESKKLLQSVVYAQSRTEAEKSRDLFGQWCTSRGYTAAADTLERDWDRMITFYDFPKEHWKHLRTTNPIESPFAYLRLRTDAAKRFKKVDNAIAVIWKLLLIGEKKFRILTAANLLKDVYYGVKFEDGVRISTEPEEVAA